jgi:chaperonin GroEL
MTKRNTGDYIPVSVTKDGYNSLHALSFIDPIKDAVLQIAKQSAGNSVVASGDGTSSTIVMGAVFARMINSGSYKNPQAAIRQIRKEVYRAAEAIKTEAVSSEKAIHSVILTSTNRDTEMTEVVNSSIKKSSAYGSIMAISSPAQKERFKIDTEFGYQCGRGYQFHPGMACSIDPAANTNQDITINNPLIVPFNGGIAGIEQFYPIIGALQKNVMIMEKGFTLVVISHEVTEKAADDAVAFNRTNAKHNVKIVFLKTNSTYEPNGSVEQLKDICAFTGAELHDGALVSSYGVQDIKYLGTCGSIRIQVTKSFLNGRAKNNRIKARAEENVITASKADCPIDKEHVEARNASLTNGLIKISVGGALASELIELKDRIDDAVKSGQACTRSGALPGCGVSYIRAGKLANVSEAVQEALGTIHRTILANYGMQDAYTENHEKGKTVFVSEDDVNPGVDFIESGVADSYETVRAVLINSFELGALVANIGGVCLEADLATIEKIKMYKEMTQE